MRLETYGDAVTAENSSQFPCTYGATTKVLLVVVDLVESLLAAT